MPGYRLEGHIPNQYVGIMMDRLCERHPLPGKTIVLTGLTSMNFPLLKEKVTAQGWIYPAVGDEISVEICFGTPDSPMPMYDAMQTVAHEYRHALQFYRDGKVYRGKYDKRLEADADAFARAERKAMYDAGYDYLYPEDKARGWKY